MKQDKKMLKNLIKPILAIVILAIGMFIVKKYSDRWFIKDHRIDYCQDLLNEYKNIDLNYYKFERIYLVDTNDDFSMIVVYYKRSRSGNAESDQKIIKDCTEDFFEKNPYNELNNKRLEIHLETESRGIANVGLTYINGKLDSYNIETVD